MNFTSSLAKALEMHDGSRLTVKGFLLLDADEAWICDELLESFPPQCGGASVELTGIGMADLSGISLRRASGVAWSETVLKIQGTMRRGRLQVERISGMK